MKIWFDTEFYENTFLISLISIGMVREDGATYYAESLLADHLCHQDPWLMTNVKPHLRGLGWEKDRVRIQEEVLEFVGESPEFWAYYGAYDWVVLCHLFGRMIDLPKGWSMLCYDFRQWLDMNDLKHIRGPENAPHNALTDAEWLARTFREYGPR